MINLPHIKKKYLDRKKIIRFIIRKSKKIISDFILTPIDYLIPKCKNYWVFPVYFIGKGNFTDNNLAIFELVKNDHTIKKVILTRDIDVSLEGNNVVIIPMKSVKAIWYLFRSKIIFIQHSIWLDLSKSIYQIINPKGRNIINLWHGIAIKDISHKNTGIINNRSLQEMPAYKVTCSSEVDKINMQKSFFKTEKSDFWITGLPRNDFLLMNEEQLPGLYVSELTNLKNMLNGKDLILYAPTYREIDVNGVYYEFSDDELDLLEEYLINKNCVLGIRYHIYRKPDVYLSLIERKNIIDLSAEVISDVRLIIREASLIITDYSSLYMDALYIEKKCLSFSYDYEHYLNTQRGFFYNFEEVFPGEICHNFSDLFNSILNKDIPYSVEQKQKLKKIQSTFFKYIDNHNSERVIAKIKKLN